MNVLICGGVFMVKQQPNRKGQAADAGNVGAAYCACMRRSCGAIVRVSLFREAKGRVCVYPAFRAGRGAHFASCRSLPSDERLGYRLRFENAVRYDGDDDGRVFHKNEQK